MKKTVFTFAFLVFAVVASARAQSDNGFENLSRAVISQMSTPDSNAYHALLPTDNDLSWIVDNIGPGDDRETYSEYYSDLALVASDFRGYWRIM
jgi:hypothetical protein